tara:strand:- start:987 stop:3200 length:2214 start_codon:yes stop_codon:yes gene_type:complete
MKFIIKLSLLLVVLIFFSIIYLAYFGISTDKFNNLIKDSVNEKNEKINLEFKNTKIHLNLRNKSFIARIKNPEVIIKNEKVKLSKIDLFLPIKSFYKKEFILNKAVISFKNNNIKDLAKISNIYLPSIINKKIKKILSKGTLEGEFILPFKENGKIDESFVFFGKILNADLKLNKKFNIDNLNAEIQYKNLSLKKNLSINISKGSLFNLNLSESLLNIGFVGKDKFIEANISTDGNIKSSELNKILSLFKIKNNYLKNISLTSKLQTNIKFSINNKMKIKNFDYNSSGFISSLKFKINENNVILNFLPSFDPNIFLKDAKINFNNKKLNIKGDLKFSKKFEKIDISHIYKKKEKKYTIFGSSTLNNSFIKFKKLNYEKEENKQAKISFKTDFVLNKYILIDYLTYQENNNYIELKNIKTNKDFEVMEISLFKVRTFNNKILNNDFVIKKDKQIVIKGTLFDAQPFLKTLYIKNDKKTFSRYFTSDIKFNLSKVLTGKIDNLFNLAGIASVKLGSYAKLSLKANYSDKEIIEMSIYQVDKDKKIIHLISDRARPFIKDFNFIKGFNDGTLEYESTINKNITSTNLKIFDFKVSKVPALTKLLSLASLQGIADTLSGEGIRFDTFEMVSNSKDNILNIEEAFAIGPAISVLLDGYIDKGKLISLNGTLVPATKLNSIIANIPLIGDILVGKKTGEGVVGVSFKMKGKPGDLKTTINPIKSLTPRFIVRAVEKIKNQKTK